MGAKCFSYFCDIDGDIKKPLYFNVKYLAAVNNALHSVQHNRLKISWFCRKQNIPCAVSNPLACEKVAPLLDHLNKLGSDAIDSEKSERENCSPGLLALMTSTPDINFFYWTFRMLTLQTFPDEGAF